MPNDTLVLAYLILTLFAASLGLFLQRFGWLPSVMRGSLVVLVPIWPFLELLSYMEVGQYDGLKIGVWVVAGWYWLACLAQFLELDSQARHAQTEQEETTQLKSDDAQASA